MRSRDLDNLTLLVSNCMTLGKFLAFVSWS